MPADTAVAPPPPAPAAAPSPNSGPKAVPPPTPAKIELATVKPSSLSSMTSRARTTEMVQAAANKAAGEAPPVPVPAPANTPPLTSKPEPDKAPVAETPKPSAEPPKPPTEPAKPVAEVKTGTEPEKTVDPDDAKLGPWQQKAKWEKRAKALEAELLSLKEKSEPVPEFDAVKTRAEKAEARRKELEEAIRLLDYSKSEEFHEKYHAPYQAAAERAVRQIQQLQITDPDGSVRMANDQDVLKLISMQPSQLDVVAEEWFGRSAPRVIQQVERVRELAEERSRALETAQKEAGERQSRTAQQFQEIQQETDKLWRQFNEFDQQNEEFLKPVDGDDEWNGTLKEAQEFVDRAATTNIRDTKMTPEQRRKVIRDKASVRGRAIGYEVLRLQVNRLKNEIAKRDEIIAGFRSATPNNGSGSPATTSTAPTNARDRSHSLIRSMADA